MEKDYYSIYYDGNVGNIKVNEDKIIFFTDNNSVNDKDLKGIININEINREKFIDSFNHDKTLLLITIETKSEKFKFEFSYENEYYNFIDVMKKIL